MEFDVDCWTDRIAHLRKRSVPTERAILFMEGMKMLGRSRKIQDPNFDMYGTSIIFAWSSGDGYANVTFADDTINVAGRMPDGDYFESDNLAGLITHLKEIGVVEDA